MKLEDGDIFESDNADWIRNNLPSYESIWSRFIGNNGHSHALELNGIPKQLNSRRKRIYQAHYSLARSVKKLHDIKEKLFEISVNKSPELSGEEQFDLLFHFMARIGHVRDMIKVIDSALNMNDGGVKNLKELYGKRNHVLHGPQIPFKFEDGEIYIPKIGGSVSERDEWDDKKDWDEVDPDKFVSINNFCEQVFDECIKIVNNVHEKIKQRMFNNFEKYELIRVEIEKNNNPYTLNSAVAQKSATNLSHSFDNSISGKYWS